MAEYIDKKILMNDMGMAQGCKMSCVDCEKINCSIGEIIDRQPTVDIKHGKLITDDKDAEKENACLKELLELAIEEINRFYDKQHQEYLNEVGEILKGDEPIFIDESLDMYEEDK